MKKFIIVFLVLSICVAIVGCSNQENYDEIGKKLQGIWKGKGEGYSFVYTFKNGEFEYYHVNSFGGETTHTGKYTIEDGKIALDNDHFYHDLTYTYDKQSGSLKVYEKGKELNFFYGYSE